MPVIMIFQKDTTGLTVAEISESLQSSLGVECLLYKDGAKVPAEDPASTKEISEANIWLDIPDIEEDEGIPCAHLEIASRLDREDAIQALVDELIEQDKSLDADLNKNSRDIIITFEDTPAAEETAFALAYVVASETGSGILVPAYEEGESTAWFEDPEDFADIVFGDEDEDELGELDEDDEE